MLPAAPDEVAVKVLDIALCCVTTMTCPEVAVPLLLASVVVVGPAAAATGVGLPNMAASV